MLTLLRMLSPRILLIGSARVPTGVGYTLLLISHMAAAVVGFGALFITGFEALRARRGPAVGSADAVRRYFRPGTNWAARVLYLVPVLGFALLADSNGAFAMSDTFVLAGLGLWLVAIVLAEVLLWPAERRIQQAVSGGWEPSAALRRDCYVVVTACFVLVLVFIAALVVMFGKP